MATAKSTRARWRNPVPDVTLESAEELEKLLGYQGSIQCTPLQTALDEQQAALYEAQAVIEVAATALNMKLVELGVPEEWRPQLALDAAAKMIGNVAEAIEAGRLEDRAIAIARKAAAAPESAS
jgi:hypothetical protein